MPTTSTYLQKHFVLTIEGNLPQAAIEIIGDNHWLMCCPLCGSIHQIQGVDEDVPYTPTCQTIPILYKAQQVIWRKLYPDAANYTQLHLIKQLA